MGDYSNYSDKKMVDGVDAVDGKQEFRVALYDSRSCSGDGHAGGGEGPNLSSLMERSMGGDWTWKPHRDTCFPQFEMPAFRGVPLGQAEIAAHARRNDGEPGAVRYGNAVLPVRKYSKLTAGVNGGFFDTSAGSHVGNKLPRRVDVEVLGSDTDRSYCPTDSYSAVCSA